jgi:hypothetical protein
VLKAQGRAEEALASYERSLDGREKFMQGHPSSKFIPDNPSNGGTQGATASVAQLLEKIAALKRTAESEKFIAKSQEEVKRLSAKP